MRLAPVRYGRYACRMSASKKAPPPLVTRAEARWERRAQDLAASRKRTAKGILCTNRMQTTAGEREWLIRKQFLDRAARDDPKAFGEAVMAVFRHVLAQHP